MPPRKGKANESTTVDTAPESKSPAATKSRKRTFNACQPCQRRKRRCNGAKPRCSECSRGNIACTYSAARRLRGKGKMKAQLIALEQRLKKLESSPQQQGGRAEASLAERQHASTDKRGDDDDPAGSTNAPGIQQPIKEGDTTSAPRRSSARLRDASQAVVALPPGQRAMSRARDRLSSIFAELQSLQFSVDDSPFARRVFVPLPRQDVASRILRSQLEVLQLHGIVFSIRHVLGLLEEQFFRSGSGGGGRGGGGGFKSSIGGACDDDDDPSRWALINALLAGTMLCKVTNEYPDAYTRPVWALFKNAFAVFPEISMIRRPTIRTCEALVAMIFFLQGTADARMMAQLVATLTRAVQELGLLHGRNAVAGQPPDEAERARRILWATSVLSADVADSFGLAPPAGLRSVRVEDDWKPDDGPEARRMSVARDKNASSESPDILRARATLAAIQLKLYEIAHDADSLHGDNITGTIRTVTAIHKKLQTWRSSNGAIIDHHAQGPPDEESHLPRILLSFIYTTCEIKIYTTLSHLASRLASRTNPSVKSRQEWTHRQQEYRQDCAAKARSIINMLPALPVHPFFQVWRMIRYPLAAMLALLFAVLEHPRSHGVTEHLHAMQRFIDYLVRLKQDDCHVDVMIEGCTKLVELAKSVVQTSPAHGQAPADDSLACQVEVSNTGPYHVSHCS
ncbi:hypothetical protein JDV02_004799 [Purpureocillium takamizusanense]|uniref:Zn(2)-C6 fungal-type domain-containing protein n=1 Tax=Purpureocillium takamizusanense TaxID=2060973 RepID=A0A9Q8QG10_9HYPO|nr:uncharacterized protein JDV02_004799 [Purpureocillium takamizusanense]UNI18536.1 hypothetical protein JDV02_004799 [Purpureocillium takamizusanense]